MADITMCESKKIDGLCRDCYRRNAKPNECSQSYFMQIPLLADGTCEEYLEDKSIPTPNK